VCVSWAVLRVTMPECGLHSLAGTEVVREDKYSSSSIYPTA